MKRDDLTQEQLVELLDYDPLTGVFKWRKRAGDTKGARIFNRRFAGKVAGNAWETGRGKTYWSIGVLYQNCFAHRLAYLYMVGKWPEAEIDHINTDGLDNRWENLRPASKSENNWNAGRNRRNTTGFKGVSARRGRFKAEIQARGVRRWLGYFDTPEAAHAAYAAASRELHGEFSRVA